MNPDILVKPSSALVSRLSKVGLFKGLTKMSEFFLGVTRSLDINVQPSKSLTFKRFICGWV